MDRCLIRDLFTMDRQDSNFIREAGMLDVGEVEAAFMLQDRG